MNLKNFLSVNAVISVIFGIPFVVAADQSMQGYGLTMCADGLALVRYYGGALIFSGVVAWLFRNIVDLASQRAICLGYVIGCFIGCGVALYNQLAYKMIGLVWLTVGLYGIFALGYCYFYFKLKK